MTATPTLAEHLLDANEAPDDDDTRDRWSIGDDAAANWALRKLAACHAELNRIADAAGAEIDAIRAWQDQASKQPARDAAFFEAKLIDYRRHLEDQDPTLAQTYKLPAGTIRRRKLPDRVTVADEEAFVAWALTNDPAALSMRPLVSRLKSFDGGYHAALEPDATTGVLVTAEGERVPGVVYVAGDDRYEAKPTAGEVDQ